MMLLIFLNMLYGSMFLLAKFGLQVAQPIFMTGSRMLFGGVVCLAIYAALQYQKKDITSITARQWSLIGLLSLINVYICNALEVWGLQYLSVGKTAFIYNLTPFFSALLAYFLFAESMTYQKWLGLLIGFLGFIPVFMGASSVVDTTLRFGFFSLAEIALVGAAISSVLGWTIMRLLIKERSFSPFFLNGMSMVIGGLLCTVHAFLFESQPYITDGCFFQYAQLVMIMGILKHVVAYNLNSYLLGRYTTTLIAFFSFTASLFATFFGLIFFKESISIYFVFSIVCVFIGLIIFYQEEFKQGYIQ